MTSQQYFGNPHFLKYTRLLHQLHLLIREGLDETSQGDVLREQMDEAAEYVSQEEVDTLTALSADFYTLSGPPWQTVAPAPMAAQEDLKRSLDERENGEFIKALEYARRHQMDFPPAMISYVRARIWMVAGEATIAEDFFNRAANLEPTNGPYAFAWLDTLWQVNGDQALKQAQTILRSIGSYPPQLIIKAADIVFAHTNGLAKNEEESIIRLLIPVVEYALARLEASGEAGLNQLFLGSAIGLLGLMYGRLGETGLAIGFFDRGLRYSPNNVALLIARGIQRYGTDAERSVQDFELAVKLGSQDALPYFFLAHYHVLHYHAEDGLRMAYKAISLTRSDILIANCYEWIAICQAALGNPKDAVLSAFQLARQRAPSNKRIESNFKRFEAGQGIKSFQQFDWEQESSANIQILARLEFAFALAG